MEKAQVKEKTRAPLFDPFFLSFSLSLDVSSVLRVSSFSRVVFPPSRCVKCYSSGTFPKKVQLFFLSPISYKCRVSFVLS